MLVSLPTKPPMASGALRAAHGDLGLNRVVADNGALALIGPTGFAQRKCDDHADGVGFRADDARSDIGIKDRLQRNLLKFVRKRFEPCRASWLLT